MKSIIDASHNTFGGFLADKRKKREITSLSMSEMLGLSPGYYCDIEKNRGRPPERSILDKMIELLRLSQEDIHTFYDLAGKARSEAPPDLPDYINDNHAVRLALRLAKDKGTEADWHRFISELENRITDEGG
jgi:transcriptional regulator with XRE-family HTH domain